MKSIVKFIVRSINVQAGIIEAIKAEAIPLTLATAEIVRDAAVVVAKFRRELLEDPDFQKAVHRFSMAEQPPEGIEDAEKALRQATNSFKRALKGKTGTEKAKNGHDEKVSLN